MRKFILLFLFTAIFTSNYAQSVNVIATSGTLNGSYPTLQAAFTKINDGTHKGAITINVVANTTETASAVLNASGGIASYTTILIQPSGGGARIISMSLATPLIDLNGANNVTIDGLNTGGNSLTISNTSTSSVAGTSSIRFIADATNNTVTNCTIQGSGTGITNVGTLFFSTGTTTGNDGNTLSNNTITSAGGNLPFNAIDSKGSSTVIDNSAISILNNNIQDYYNPAGNSNGIFIESNSSAWTISNNKLFQTATRTSTAAATPRAINIVTASGIGYTISNNIIGYASAVGTGVTTYDGAFANKFLAIEMNVGTAAVSNVQGNIINGISLSTTNALATAPGIFSGISILAGNINIGTTTGNTIGATTGTGSISVTSTTTLGYIAGIYATSTGTVSIQNNNIGSISTGGTALIGYTFHGINTAGAAGNFTIASNTVGSTTTANSITIGTDVTTTTGVCTFNGITNASTGTTSITNNTIQNCSVYGTGASVFNGIVNSGSTGTINITTNNIISGTNTGTGNFIPISNVAAAATVNINTNVIRNHTRTAASGAFTGISNTGASTGTINISNNQIGNNNGGALTFNNASSGTITGISNNAGTATTTINMNSNSMQGFAVVSSGAFTGIINAGAATGVAININSNQIGTTTGNIITYSAANSTSIIGISNTGGASTCALSIQSNDIRGIVHSVAGTSPHTYIINSAPAATLSQNISTNTFTNLNVNTTGAITFISNSVVVSATGTQNVDGNSIVGSFTRTNTSISGALTLFTSSASSVAGGVISNSNNNFSNITVSGAATIAGWVNTDAGSGTKTIQGNTFSNWTGGTGLITGMNINISGAGNAITGNNINNFNSGGNITAITTGAGNDNIYSNTISSISSTGTGSTLVNGIVVTAGTTKNIYQNTISGLKANFSNLSGNVQNSLAVNGIWISGGTTVNVNQNIISGFTADAIDAGTINGITVSGGSTVTVFRNKIYDLSSNSTAINAGGISGIFVFSVGGSVTNIINNMIGDIRTPVSGNSDSYRGISINTATTSNINVYFNTIYLNSTSSGANFGCTGIYHAFSSNSLIGKLDLRNNIITNLSTPTGTGLTALFRQYGAALDNYASTSNNNLYYAGTPGPKRVIFFIDPSSSDQTLSAFKARLVNREGQSFTEDVTVNFLSLVGSSPYFLHIDSTICTRLESGGVNISGITDDYDGQVRQGNPGYIGTGTAPDIGADEFEGNAIPTAVLSGTATICNGSSATLSLAVTGTGTLSGTLSDGTAFSGTAPTITVSISPSTTTTYTIATLSSGTCTSGSADKTGSAVVTVNARPTGALSGTATICNGGSTNLTITATGTGTISGNLSDGTAFSGTAPTIIISISPSSTTTYTIATLTNGTCASIAADKTGSARITVTSPPSATISYSGSPYCSGSGTATVTRTGTSGGTYSSTAGLIINSSTGDVTIGSSTPGNYTVTYTIGASGGCSQYQTTATITIVTPGTWSGAVNTDWNTSGNWICGQIPTTTTNAIIPGSLTNYPVINSGTNAVQNINIQSGASLTVNNSTFQISGSISNSGTFIASNGTIEMNGSAAQTIPAGAFQNNALNNLIISNSNASGVSLGGALDLYGSLSFGAVNSKTFSTSGFLTLKSSATGTASVADLTNNNVNSGNQVLGDVTVERYISAAKKWRFLSIPTGTNQTIKAAWQEGCGANLNCVANFGTQITGVGGTAAGFDVYTATPSMKTYNSGTNSYIAIPNTNTNLINNPSNNTVAYFVFVRGDRSATTFTSPVSATNLSTKGVIKQGNQAVVSIASPATAFTAVGNPYPSRIDLRKMTPAPTTATKIYVWDPIATIGSVYGLGAYQTITYDGTTFTVTPGGGSYGAPYNQDPNYIESGEAFFAGGNASAYNITFKEDIKASGNNLVSFAYGHPQSLKANLFINKNGVTSLMDGITANIGNNFSNDLDDDDAYKISNSAENVSLKRNGQLLSVERHNSISATDTFYLNLGNMRSQNYEWQLNMDNLDQPGLTGFLEDTYLNTSTPLNLNGSTIVDFNIENIPGSYAADRFRIVFTPTTVLPLSFTNVKAYQKNTAINVEWKVENESNMKQYDVEKSVDGNHFTKANTIAANNATVSNYNWPDVNAAEGYNYYRIKSIDVNGKIEYSKIVSVNIPGFQQKIYVQNNTFFNTINVRLANQPKEKVVLRLYDAAGKLIVSKEFKNVGNLLELNVLPATVSKGIYILEVKVDGETFTYKLIKE